VERFGKWLASLAGNLTDGHCLELTGYLGNPERHAPLDSAHLLS